MIENNMYISVPLLIILAILFPQPALIIGIIYLIYLYPALLLIPLFIGIFVGILAILMLLTGKTIDGLSILFSYSFFQRLIKIPRNIVYIFYCKRKFRKFINPIKNDFLSSLYRLVLFFIFANLIIIFCILIGFVLSFIKHIFTICTIMAIILVLLTAKIIFYIEYCKK